jgi:hypothetical protein
MCPFRLSPSSKALIFSLYLAEGKVKSDRYVSNKFLRAMPVNKRSERVRNYLIDMPALLSKLVSNSEARPYAL